MADASVKNSSQDKNFEFIPKFIGIQKMNSLLFQIGWSTLGKKRNNSSNGY